MSDMDPRTIIAKSELMRTIITLYGWPVEVQAYFVDGIAGPIETLAHGGVDAILGFAQEPGIVLDAGCGTGLTTILARRRGIDIVGIDSSQASLELARQLGRVIGLAEEELSSALILGDVTDLAYPDNHFSVVICYQVIEHVDDVVAVLRELVRCLRPGGYLHLVGPDYRFSFEPHYRIPWPPFMDKGAAAAEWLRVFDRPLGGLATFNYVSLPQVLGLLATLGVEVISASTTTPEAMIEEQRQSVSKGATWARQNNVQTIETSFMIVARK